MNDPIISTSVSNARGDPEIASPICVYQKGGVKAFRSRVLLGWSHQNDTSGGLRGGKVWCWVSDGAGALQVYDEHFNRSEKPGDPRFCGVANFTMVRMFHPYWARGGRPPRDTRSGDKSWCRNQYNALMRRHRRAQGWAVDDGSDESAETEEAANHRKRRRAPKRSTGRKAINKKPRKVRTPDSSDARSSRPSSSENDRWAVPDGSSDSDSEDEPLMAKSKRQMPHFDTSDEDDQDSDSNDGHLRYLRTPGINRNAFHRSSATPKPRSRETTERGTGLSSMFLNTATPPSQNERTRPNQLARTVDDVQAPRTHQGVHHHASRSNSQTSQEQTGPEIAIYDGVTVQALPILEGADSPSLKKEEREWTGDKVEIRGTGALEDPIILDEDDVEAIARTGEETALDTVNDIAEEAELQACDGQLRK